MNSHENHVVEASLRYGSTRPEACLLPILNQSSISKEELVPRCNRVKYLESLGIKRSPSSGKVIPLKLKISKDLKVYQKPSSKLNYPRRTENSCDHFTSVTDLATDLDLIDDESKQKLRSISVDRNVSLKFIKEPKPPPCTKVVHSIINNSVKSEKGCRKGRTASFDDSLSVHPIPTRHQYPVQVRKELWSCKREILHNMKRNATEFAAEGWNWKLAVEDDDMILGQNGELIHPVHMVAGGNWTVNDKEDIYSGVVRMDTVRIGFFLGELYGLSCCACDIGNAFLYGKTKEKVYITAGPEFGATLCGKNLIINKSDLP
jgi:hypothetical protein